MTSYSKVSGNPEINTPREGAANLLLGIARGFPEVGIADLRGFIECIKSMGVGVKAFGLEVKFEWERSDVPTHTLLREGLKNLLKDLRYRTDVIIILLDDLHNQIKLPGTFDYLFQVLSSEDLENESIVFGGALVTQEALTPQQGAELDKQLVRFFSGEMLNLSDFTFDQVRELAFQTLAGTGVTFEEEVIEMAYRYTIGHPYATQVLFNHLYRDQIGGFVGRELFEKSLRNSMMEMYPLLRSSTGAKP